MRRIDVIALGIGVALLALGPLALTLARADSYHSTAVVSLNPDNPSARYLPNPAKFLTDPLKVRDLQRHVAEDVDWFNVPRDLPDHVKVVSQGGGQFAIVAEGPGAQEAQDLAEATARRLRDAAEASGAFMQGAQLRKLPRGARRDAIAASVREHQDIFAAAPTTATLPKERLGDRVVGALPGKRAFRPDPVWAALAGVALAMALALWALALGPMRSRSSGSTSS
jgi:hypothetical protein